MDMSDAAKRGEERETVGETTVSDGQVSIPPEIRERAGIEDGDRLRWQWRDGELSVQVIQRGVFEDFEGFEGECNDLDFDRVGLAPAGEWDAPDGN